MKNITITELDEKHIRKNHEQDIYTFFLYKDDIRYIYEHGKDDSMFSDMCFFYACLGKPDYIVHHIIIDGELCSMRITKKYLTYYNNGKPLEKAKNEIKTIYNNFDKIEGFFQNVDIEEFRKMYGSKVVSEKFKIFF